jgi:hypothetical protein
MDINLGDEVMKIAQRALKDDDTNRISMKDGMLLAIVAGQLDRLARFDAADTKPAAAGQPDPLTLADM